MTYYIKRGNIHQIVDEANLQVTNILPNGTYSVAQNPETGEFFFVTVDGFNIRGKIYGDPTSKAKRILNTFEDRPSGTGVLLSGEKGSGKTLLAKMLSVEGLKRDYVTIVVNTPFHGDGFNKFIQQIEQPAIVMFDEFEKVYHEREWQDAILTLLDGTYSSKKLFVVTCNDRWKLSEFMHNRPGRFYYLLEYYGLDEAFVREYATDRLKNQKLVEDVVKYSQTFKAFNFDMLQAMVEEMNRYDEGVQEVLKYLNVSSKKDTFSFEVVKWEPAPGLIPVDAVQKFTKFDFNKDVNSGNPMPVSCESVYVYAELIDENFKEGDPDRWIDDVSAHFSYKDIVRIDGATITYENKDLGRLIITKKHEKEFSYFDY